MCLHFPDVKFEAQLLIAPPLTLELQKELIEPQSCIQQQSLGHCELGRTDQLMGL